MSPLVCILVFRLRHGNGRCVVMRTGLGKSDFVIVIVLLMAQAQAGNEFVWLRHRLL